MGEPPADRLLAQRTGAGVEDRPRVDAVDELLPTQALTEAMVTAVGSVSTAIGVESKACD